MSCKRREWLSGLGAMACGTLFSPVRARGGDLPASPVSIARCATYGGELLPALETMFDQLGGLEGLVRGKTVAVKINLVGDPWSRLGDSPPELSHWTHPAVIGAALYLLGRAGAARLRVLECCGETTDPMEAYLRDAGWDPACLLNAAPGVELENTNGPGSESEYSRVSCQRGGYIFPAYEVNRSYTDCDVFVSIAKMKEHSWFGVTLSMKNCYGMMPLPIYGDGAGLGEPSLTAQGTRVTVLHNGDRPPSKSAPQENDPASPQDGAYGIPRIVAEVVSARPVHLAILDGIETMAGGEGPWAEHARRVSPGILAAGLNPVNTDAAGVALMGFDPTAERGTPPFDGCDSFLHFAEELGLGARDLASIEVRGTPIAEARFDFRGA